MNKEKVLEVLQMIADDQKNDSANFDGQPFNGRTVAEYFGNQGAAIAALAKPNSTCRRNDGGEHIDFQTR